MAESDTPAPALPRRRPDASPEFAAVPGPVVPVLTGGFELRVLDPDAQDVALLTQWMSLPHLAETWEQSWPADQWAADARARLAGNYSTPLIISLDGVDLGYLELYRVARDEVGAVYDVQPYDMGVHIALADTARLGHGIGTAVLANVATGVFAAEAECTRLVGDPAADNVRVRRALVKAGYTEHGIHDVRPGRRIALMIRSREA